MSRRLCICALALLVLALASQQVRFTSVLTPSTPLVLLHPKEDPSVLEAALLAEQTVNNNKAAYGLSAPIELLLIPTSGDQTALTTLVPVQARGAVGVVGCYFSEDSTQVQLSLRPFNIPMISYASSAADLSNKDEYPTFLRTVRPATDDVRALVSLVKHFGWTQVGLLMSQTGFGETLKLATPLLQAAGVSVVTSVSLSLSISEYQLANSMSSLRLSGAQIILMNLQQSHVKPVLQMAADLGLVGPDYVFVSGTTTQLDDTLAWMNQTPEKFAELQLFSLSAVSPNPSYAAFTNTLTAPDLGYAGRSYDAVTSFAYALGRLNQAGDLTNEQYTSDKLLAALKTLNYDGKWGRVDYDASGDPSQASVFQVEYSLGTTVRVTAGKYANETFTKLRPIQWANSLNLVPTGLVQSAACDDCVVRENVTICVGFGVPLPEPNSFFGIAKRGVDWAAEDCRVTTRFLVTNPGERFNETLHAVVGQCDAVVSTVWDSDVKDALVRHRDSGARILTINYDTDAFNGDFIDLGYVGQDEFLAGQTAGNLIVKAGASKRVFYNMGGQRAAGVVDACAAAGLPATTYTAAELATLDDLLARDADSSEFVDFFAGILSKEADYDSVILGGDLWVADFLKVQERLPNIRFIGSFDLGQDTYDALAAKKLLFAIHQDQYMQGYLPVVLAMLQLTYNMNPITRFYKSGPVVVQQDNYEPFKCFIDFDSCKKPQQVGRPKEVRMAVVLGGQPENVFWNGPLAGFKQSEVDVRAKLDFSGYWDDNFPTEGFAAREMDRHAKSPPEGVITPQKSDEITESLKTLWANGAWTTGFNWGVDGEIALSQIEGNKHLAAVLPDDRLGGELAAQEFVKMGVKHVVFFDDWLSLDAVRYLGAKGVLEQAGIAFSFVAVRKVLALQPSQDVTTMNRVEVFFDALNRNPNIDAVLVFGTMYLESVITAVRLAQRTVKLGSFDVNGYAFLKMGTGEVSFLIDQQSFLQGYLPPVLMMQAVRTASRLAQPLIFTGPRVINKQNFFEVECGMKLSDSCQYPICPQGQYFAFDPSGRPLCKSCPAGTFQPGISAMDISDCVLCSAGTSSDVTAAKTAETCKPCSPGTHSSSDGSTVCQECPPDAFCPLGAVTQKYANSSEMLEAVFPAPPPAPPAPDLSPSDVVIIVFACISLVTGIVLYFVVKYTGKFEKVLVNNDRATPLDISEIPTLKAIFLRMLSMLTLGVWEPEEPEPKNTLFRKNWLGGVLTVMTVILFVGYVCMYVTNYFTTEVVSTSVVPMPPDLVRKHLPLTLELALFGGFGPCVGAMNAYSFNHPNASFSEQLVENGTCIVRWETNAFSPLFQSNISFSTYFEQPFASTVAYKVSYVSYLSNETEVISGVIAPEDMSLAMKGSRTSSVNFNVYDGMLYDSIRDLERQGMLVQMSAIDVGDVVGADEFYVVPSKWHVSLVLRWSSFMVETHVDRIQPFISMVSEVLATSALLTLGLYYCAFLYLCAAEFFNKFVNAAAAANDAQLGTEFDDIKKAGVVEEQPSSQVSDAPKEANIAVHTE